MSNSPYATIATKKVGANTIRQENVIKTTPVRTIKVLSIWKKSTEESN